MANGASKWYSDPSIELQHLNCSLLTTKTYGIPVVAMLAPYAAKDGIFGMGAECAA